MPVDIAMLAQAGVACMARPSNTNEHPRPNTTAATKTDTATDIHKQADTMHATTLTTVWVFMVVYIILMATLEVSYTACMALTKGITTMAQHSAVLISATTMNVLTKAVAPASIRQTSTATTLSRPTPAPTHLTPRLTSTHANIRPADGALSGLSI